MSKRDASDFDDSWLDKSSKELDELLGEGDAEADDTLDDLLGAADDGDAADDAWLHEADEVIALNEEDVVTDAGGAPAGSLDDAEFEKWLEETAGGSKAAEEDSLAMETATGDEMEQWLREVTVRGEPALDEGMAESGSGAAAWSAGAMDLGAEEIAPAGDDLGMNDEFGDTYVQVSALHRTHDEAPADMEMADAGLAGADMGDDEPFDADRMSMADLGAIDDEMFPEESAADLEPDLDLDEEEELERAGASLTEAFTFGDDDIRDEETGATGIFYTEDLGDESAAPSLSDDRFPPPEQEFNDEERFTFDEPRPRPAESTTNLFERATSGLRERVTDTVGGTEDFSDIGGAERSGGGNWLFGVLAGIALVAGGTGTWLGLQGGSEATALAKRVDTLEQRSGKEAGLQQEVQRLSGGLDQLRKELDTLAVSAAAAAARPAAAPADMGGAYGKEIEELQRVTENLSQRLTTLSQGSMAAAPHADGASAPETLRAEMDGLKKLVAEIREQKAAPHSEVESLRRQVNDLATQVASLSAAGKRAPANATVEVKPLDRAELKPEVPDQPGTDVAEAPKTPAKANDKKAAKEPAPEGVKPPSGELDGVRPAGEKEKAVAEAPAPSAAPAPQGGFAINLLSINNEKAAIQAQEKLRKDGIETQVRTATIKGGTWYRVRAEGFANPQEAKKFLQDHQNHPEFKGAWISKN